jgi:hypothetical protein
MAFLYHITGKQYDVVKETPKFVHFRVSGDTCGDIHKIARDDIKFDGVASLRFSYYIRPPAWPTEGRLGELYAELREVEATREAAYRTWNEAGTRKYELERAIKDCELEQNLLKTGVSE